MRQNHANTIALVAVVLIAIVAVFYFLTQTPNHSGKNQTATSTEATSTASSSSTPSYYTDTSTWQIDEDSLAGFSIAYPLDFDVQVNEAAPPPATPLSTDWRLDANGTGGTLAFTLTIPKAFEPQTNFSDAKLTVGMSADKQAVADCLTPDATGAPNATETTTTINGVAFTVFTSSDAGAGNFYDTTSYRTLHDSKCYAVEYTIHSSNIENYPASYGLQPFDEAKVKDVLDRIVGTFAFL